MTDVDALPAPANGELYYLVMRLARSFNRACEDIAWRDGVVAAEVNVLLVLGEGVPLSSAQLARRAFMTPQASHQLVTRLLDSGLVDSQPHPSNRRVRLVSLTEEGRALLGRVRRDLREVQERAMQTLAAAERDRLRADLLAVATTLQGGWFGDPDAEAAAAERRAGRVRSRGRSDEERETP